MKFKLKKSFQFVCEDILKARSHLEVTRSSHPDEMEMEVKVLFYFKYIPEKK